MSKLNNYKNEIHKCSKCGLCQSVCPVYEQTGNDCSVSRGKFIMLNGVVKGDLKLNKNINKYLDMCLKCNACKNFCPSGINAREIFLAAKADYFSSCPSSKIIKAFQAKIVFNSVLSSIKLATTLYRGLKIDKLARQFYPFLLKFGFLGKKVILANEFVSMDAVGKVCPTDGSKENVNLLNIVYFKGCVNEYVNPRTKNAAEFVLAKMDVNIRQANFDCCGVPFLSCGNFEQFKKQAEFNLAQIPDEFDFFLTDCASCQSAFKEYENHIEDEKLLKKLKNINEKSINIVDFILNQIESIEFENKTTFTFHKPCHLENSDFLNDIISKSRNVEYFEMDDFDKCCGFSGEFALKNIELSQKISKKKIKNALSTNADYILTTCPSCILGLSQGLIEHGCFKTPILNFVEFLALADKISFKD